MISKLMLTALVILKEGKGGKLISAVLCSRLMGRSSYRSND